MEQGNSKNVVVNKNTALTSERDAEINLFLNKKMLRLHGSSSAYLQA